MIPNKNRLFAHGSIPTFKIVMILLAHSQFARYREIAANCTCLLSFSLRLSFLCNNSASFNYLFCPRPNWFLTGCRQNGRSVPYSISIGRIVHAIFRLAILLSTWLTSPISSLHASTSRILKEETMSLSPEIRIPTPETSTSYYNRVYGDAS